MICRSLLLCKSELVVVMVQSDKVGMGGIQRSEIGNTKAYCNADAEGVFFSKNPAKHVDSKRFASSEPTNPHLRLCRSQKFLWPLIGGQAFCG